MVEKEITEPTQIESPEEDAHDEGTVDPKELLTELENLGITSAEKLQGVVTASHQAGRNAQLLGDERKQTEALQQQIMELQRQVSSQQSPSSESYYSDEADIKTIVKNAFSEMYEEKIAKPQKEAQKQYLMSLAEIENIKNDKRFSMVADRWDTHMASPEVQLRLQMNKTTPLNEYNNLVLDTMQELLFRTKGTVEQLYKQGAKTTTTDAPHVESTDTQTVPSPNIDEEIAEKIKKLTKPETRMGTDDETQDIMMTILPKDDPIWQKNR